MSIFKSKSEKRKYQNGIWQYLLDHAKPCNTGYKIFFVAKNKKEFFRRVKARVRGHFERKDVKELRKRRLELRDDYKRLKTMYSEGMKKRHALKTGNIFDKVAAWVLERLEDYEEWRVEE